MSQAGDGAKTTEALQTALHAALSIQAADLATRWRAQSRRILLLDVSPSDDVVGAAADTDVALGLVNALLATFAIGDEESEAAAVGTGLQFGVDAFTRGASLHHTLRAVDVLIAMVMHAMERVAADTEPSGNVAAGIWLARRLQGRAGLLAVCRLDAQSGSEKQIQRPHSICFERHQFLPVLLDCI